MTFKTLQNRTSQNSRTVKRLQCGELYISILKKQFTFFYYFHISNLRNNIPNRSQATKKKLEMKRKKQNQTNYKQKEKKQN